jgi:hypothetical protein
MTLSAIDSAALRRVINLGDHTALNRYLTEGAAGAAPVSITTATVSLNPTQHAGRPLLFNRAAGIAATLPYATGTGDKYEVIVQTAWASGELKIVVGRAADTMIGTALSTTLAGTAAFMDGVGGTDDTIIMAGTTTGGLAGSRIILTDIVANLWLVNAQIIGSGTMITSFSATV